jgi:hypothetical protein
MQTVRLASSDLYAEQQALDAGSINMYIIILDHHLKSLAIYCLVK